MGHSCFCREELCAPAGTSKRHFVSQGAGKAEDCTVEQITYNGGMRTIHFVKVVCRRHKSWDCWPQEAFAALLQFLPIKHECSEKLWRKCRPFPKLVLSKVGLHQIQAAALFTVEQKARAERVRWSHEAAFNNSLGFVPLQLARRRSSVTAGRAIKPRFIPPKRTKCVCLCQHKEKTTPTPSGR